VAGVTHGVLARPTHCRVDRKHVQPHAVSSSSASCVADSSFTAHASRFISRSRRRWKVCQFPGALSAWRWQITSLARGAVC